MERQCSVSSEAEFERLLSASAELMRERQSFEKAAPAISDLKIAEESYLRQGEQNGNFE
ncbi:MAG: hypothetical protein WBE13_20915 [Candidatus Acidiferrum sp.]